MEGKFMYEYNENVRDLTNGFLDLGIKRALEATKAVETVAEAIYNDFTTDNYETAFGYVKLKNGSLGFTLSAIETDNGLQSGGYMVVKIYKIKVSNEDPIKYCCIDMKKDIPKQIEEIINATCKFFEDTGTPKSYAGHRGVCL